MESGELVLRKTNKYLVSLIVLFGLVAFYPVVARKYFQFKYNREKRALDATPAQLFRSQSTVEFNGNQGFIGRGYLDYARQTIFTNHHVLEKYCPSVPGHGCQGSTLDVIQLSRPHVHNPIKIRQSICWEWLDICALRLGNPGLLEEPTVFEPPTKTETLDLHLLTLSRDNQALEIFDTRGASIHEGEVSSVLAVPSRKGLSGSPVFNGGNELAGLVWAGIFDFNIFTLVTDRIFWKDDPSEYHPLSLVLTAQTVHEIAECLTVTAEQCLAIEQAMLVKNIRDLALKARDRHVPLTLRLLMLLQMKVGTDDLARFKRGNIPSQAFDKIPNDTDFVALACGSNQTERMNFMAIRILEKYSQGQPFSFTQATPLSVLADSMKNCSTSAEEKAFHEDVKFLQNPWGAFQIFGAAA
ncbi:MAG TPA: hypothetical protein VE954_31725 [Oligoflexus sp.]|uniref:hypothetical protein n=1 Tax=Oligoflexus sp. TaxID=1971216 RepID=UPI002D7027CE|nr:hypothetical protein [Oligoflexus sp.]HYX37694.1 hypothetical protein [Oligoflexus sp.]